MQQSGDDDSLIHRLQSCVAQSVRTEQSQSVQSLRTRTDDVLHVVIDRQSAGDGDGRCRAAAEASTRRLLPANSISTLFARFKCRLLERAHDSTLSNSAALLCTFAAGMIMYVSSAYLQSCLLYTSDAADE